jgi:molybdopterin synthase sulfur carrier subunit
MSRVVLASALSRWLPAEAAGGSREAAFDIDATDLRALLDALFARHPNLRGYVLDERGTVRHHVAIFVDGGAIRDKSDLGVPLVAVSEVYIMQALSGG